MKMLNSLMDYRILSVWEKLVIAYSYYNFGKSLCLILLNRGRKKGRHWFGYWKILKDEDDISLQRRCLFFWGAVSCLRKALLLWCYSFLVMPSVKWRPLRPALPRKAKKTKTRRKKNQRVKRRKRKRRRRRRRTKTKTKTRRQVGEKSHGVAQMFRLELRTATGVFNLWKKRECGGNFALHNDDSC